MSKRPKLDEKADAEVRRYCHEIVDLANAMNVEADIELNFELAVSKDDIHAAEGVITSEYGVVMVFPDFVNQSAKACVLQIGMIQYLRKEGFSEDEIWTNHPIFGAMLDKSPKSVAMFAHYLTHKTHAVR